ncbi:acetyltransferase [Periweissella beninensis]|nr:acetyltransferase [Periweissella beninensis]
MVSSLFGMGVFINMGNSTTRRRYILGFDGIRALAVLGVILYHILPNVFRGGYLGVPIFFVVSGYLITDLLLQEFEKHNSINLKKFYLRRIKRLYPALLVMLLATSAYITLFNPGALIGLRANIGMNLTYVYNFWEIKHGQSYFQQFTAPSPFTHLWSLSVEGQFYLIWPLLVYLCAKFKVKRIYIFSLLIISSLFSAICLAVFFDPANINRAYYGTDTRLFAILLGASLAYLWPSNHLRLNLAPKNQKILNTLSFISLFGLTIGFLTLNGQAHLTYFGGMYLFTICATIFVATIAHPTTWLIKILDNKVFNWLGTRSYGIYLYQYPVLVFFEQKIINYRTHLIFYVMLELLIIGVISEISYRYLEVPIKNSNFAFWQTYFERLVTYQPKIILVTVTFFILIGASISGLLAPQAATTYQTPLQKQLAFRHKQASQQNKKLLKTTEQDKNKSNRNPQHQIKLSTTEQKLAHRYHLTARQITKLKHTNISGIGDSMMVNVGPNLQKIMPVIVNGHVGRQAALGPVIIQKQLSQKQLMNNVLIMLGTNGNIYPHTLQQTMQKLGPHRQVFWVNNYVKRPWTKANVNLLNKARTKYRNLHVINWHKFAQKHNNWFGPDGIHPNPTGDIHLTNLIAKSIAKYGI